jgi:hypothetical protein
MYAPCVWSVWSVLSFLLRKAEDSHSLMGYVTT